MRLSISSKNYIRTLANAGAKYVVEIVDGDKAPHKHHEDGFTKWRNGRPVKYTRATNIVYVGKNWLIQNFPAAVALARLENLEIEFSQNEKDARNWLIEVKARNTYSINSFLNKTPEYTFEPESEHLFA